MSNIAKLILELDEAASRWSAMCTTATLDDAHKAYNLSRAALERAYDSHTEPGLRRSLEIVGRQIQAYVTPNSDYSHGVMDMAKAFSKAIRTELDKLEPKLSPDFDYWPMTVAKPGTPPATPDRSAAVLRELEWGGRGRAGIGGKYIANCPICGGPKEAMPAFDIPAGHQPDCSLAAALATPSGDNPVGAVSDIDLVLDVLSAPTWDDEHQHQAAVERLCKVLASRPSDPVGVGVKFHVDRAKMIYENLQAERAETSRLRKELATRPAPSVVTVTDDMIKRGLVVIEAAQKHHVLISYKDMHAALEAALAPKEGETKIV